MALAYISPGESLSAARWNSLLDDLDNALSALYSGKSPYAWGAQNSLLTGLEFLFGNPSNRKILAGDNRVYSHQTFLTIAPTLSLVDTDESTREWTFTDATQAQYEQVASMFGLGASFKSDCELNDCWLFDFSLEVMKAEYAFGSADLGWLRKYTEGRNAASLAPSEQLHDRAVAEIIVEGLETSLINWPARYGKFGCLRFHNLDRQDLTVRFPDGTTVTIPHLGCKVVRQTGASAGRRTAWDVRGTYLWRFQSGDAPIWRADRNRARGVWGCSGYSTLNSIALLHDWLDAPGAKFHFDPRIKWDATNLYASTFGLSGDSDCLAKFSKHLGTYRSLKKMPDDSWESSVGQLSWNANRIIGTDVVVEVEGETAAVRSRHDGVHDVIPLTTNLLPAEASNIPSAGVAVEFVPASVQFGAWSPSQFQVFTRYYSGDGQPVDLQINVDSATSTLGQMAVTSPFTMTVEKAKTFQIAGQDGPDSSVATFSARTANFDGLTLDLYWTVTVQKEFQLNTLEGGVVPTNLAAWSLGSQWEFAYAYTIARAENDYALIPGRYDRFTSDGPGYSFRGNWVFARHPDFYRGNSDDAQDWRWNAPDVEKLALRYHAQAPTQVETRNSPVIPDGSNWIRAAIASSSADWWVENRDAILAGTLTDEDKRRILRMPGSVEHYNHIAARLNALKAITPYQLTELVYYGTPFVQEDANGLSAHHERFWIRTDTDATTTARTSELFVATYNASDVPVFSELAAVESEFYFGENSALYEALPLIGLPSSNTPPSYVWTTTDEMAALSERLGVPFWSETVGRLQRLGVYRGATETDWSTSWFTALWETASEQDFISRMDQRATVHLCEWTTPIEYTDTLPDNIDYIQAQFPQGAGGDGIGNLNQHRAVAYQNASHFPSTPSGWTARSESKVLIHPRPHFRYAGTTDDRFGLYYVPIETVEAPPASTRVFDLVDICPSGTTRILTPTAVRELMGGDDTWGNRTMFYLTLIPRVAIWRT